MAFTLFVNYVGVPISNTTGVYDTVKSGILQLLGGSRQKTTYYPSKRDEAIIWDTELLEKDPKRDVNPLVFQITLPERIPSH